MKPKLPKVNSAFRRRVSPAPSVKSKLPGIGLCLTAVSAAVGLSCSLPQSASAQSATATAAINDYNNAFLVTSGGQTYYKTALNNGNEDGTWTLSLDIQGEEDAYEVSGNASQQTTVNNLCNSWLYYNPPPWSWDGYNDDIGWFTISLARGYQMTGTANFLTQAEYGFNYAFGRGWDTTYNGGGIWEQNPSYTTGTLEKTALANDSLAKTAVMIYQSTGNTTYLNEAEQIYAWVWHHIYNPSTGQVYSGIYTNGTVDTGADVYNQGTFADLANLLYEAGAGGTYLNDAENALNWAKNNEVDGNGVFNNTAGYLNTWADEYARAIGHVCGYTPSLWGTYYSFMSKNATAAWNNRRTDYNVTWNGWDTATPETANMIPSVCVSAVAMQQFTPASQPPTSITGTHSIINKYSRLALEDPGFASGNGTNMDQWTYNGGSNQKWNITQNSDGSYTLLNGSSGLALDDPGSSMSNGTILIQWTSNGGANQHWTITPGEDGAYTIINKASGLAAEDPGFSTANGTRIDQWGSNGGNNQRWILQ